MLYRAFVDEDDENAIHRIEYYHTPSRWLDNALPINHPIRDESSWSCEIKYLDSTNTVISDEIKKLPDNHGGIYMFYIKGTNLDFIEKHILYIGRSRYTKNQNIRKRAIEYFSEKDRVLIKKMFRLWSNYLYYRYYASTDNTFIDETEATLIRAILPPMNEKIPDKVNVQPAIPAF
jgi:hypothetical protein